MPFFWFLFVQTLRTLFVNRLTLWLGKTKLGIWLKNNFDIVCHKLKTHQWSFDNDPNGELKKAVLELIA